jgi:hypothetical protein
MRHLRYIGWLRWGWSWRRLAVVLALALLLVVPASIPRHAGLPPLVSEAHAANCRLVTIYGKEKSTVGVVQYRLKERVYWCASSGRVTYWSVAMVVTYTAPFWSVAGSDAYGYWVEWNGRFHGIRRAYRGKTMEGCVAGGIGGCLKTKHPWIEVGTRADLGMTLDWNTRDLIITRVEI